MKKELTATLLRLTRALARRLAAMPAQAADTPAQNAAQRATIIDSTRGHDMAADPDEAYYSEQYWHWIAEALDAAGVRAGGTGIDLGCGQGRLTTRLAQRLSAGRVTGVDFSDNAIAAAQHNARSAGISNVDYVRSPIADFVQGLPASACDIALMTEVSFYYPGWRQDLDGIKRVLRPGGLLAMAFRTQYYDALSLVRAGMLEQVDMLLAQRSGALLGGEVELTWQTSAELRELFETQLGMRIMRMTGIGCCSGIRDDPHGTICRPSQLAPADRRDLMRLELALGPQLPDCGRYVLVIAAKEGGTA